MAKVTQTMKELRKAKDMTLVDLSNATGITPCNLSAIERGKTKPTPASIHKISTALGLTYEDLFDIFGGLCILNWSCPSKDTPCKSMGGGPAPCTCNGPQGNAPVPCNCNGGTNQCIGTSYGC